MVPICDLPDWRSRGHRSVVHGVYRPPAPRGPVSKGVAETAWTSATSQDLELAVEEKRFRRDLHYRINTVIISTPPLRSRGNDILLLAQHFLKKQAARQDKAVVGIGVAVVRKLLDYGWPGNVHGEQDPRGADPRA